ncbi:hypothetical protein [Achromobacter sp. UBA2119]|uniref:hypothetical protein n=1 Tax=Achromobacter sp. UBA2119 TaxID=1945911 RepID=UPI00257E73F1|nr:hypothetical protein [Achromobacter sp. UBA2119]
MADHHTRPNPLGQDILFTTPASLMLDARLTPLERNGWQVLRMLRSAEGISLLANLGQLRSSEAADPLPLSGDSAGSTLVPQQTGHARHMTAEQGSMHKTYMYRKERTYRAREGDGDPASQSVSLPPCLSNAQADQQRDVQAALRRLPPPHRQEVLDELQARSQSGTVRNVVAYFFALVKRVFAGEFRLWAGRKETSAAPQAAENRPAGVPRTEHRPEPTAPPASRETALAHIANIREMLNAPRRTLGTSQHRQCRPGDGSRILLSKCCREMGRHCAAQ